MDYHDHRTGRQARAPEPASPLTDGLSEKRAFRRDKFYERIRRANAVSKLARSHWNC
jgi:hypothetical protein